MEEKSHHTIVKRGYTVKLMKRTILIMLVLLVLTAPALSLAETNYEEGNGWVFQEGTLTITDNGGLKDFTSNDQDEQTGEWTYQHSARQVDILVIGKDVNEALEITNKAVAEALGGLPAKKMHCSVLAEEGIRAAIEDYMKKKGKEVKGCDCCTKDCCSHKE